MDALGQATSSDTPGVVLALFEAVSSVFTLLISCHLSYQLYGEHLLYSIGIVRRSPGRDDYVQITRHSIKILSFTAVWLYTLTNTLLALRNWFSRASHGSTAHDLLVLSEILWTIGQLSMYLLIITRLRSTFEGSIHQSSNAFYIILCALAVIFAIAMGGGQCYITMNPSITRTLNDGLAFRITIWTVVFVVDFTLSSIVMYTFLSKLQNLTAHCRAFSPQSDYQHDVHNVKMIQAESKHFRSEKKQLKRKMRERKRAQQRAAIVV